MSRVLVTGMSGTGKSSALAQLASRRYLTVDTDEPGWGVHVGLADDPLGEWLWDETKMGRLLDDARGSTLFVAGAHRNQGRFYDKFEAVVLLSVPAEVILRRVSERVGGEWGSSHAERQRILSDLAWAEPLLRATATHEIDATCPLAAVVDELLAIASASKLPEPY